GRGEMWEGRVQPALGGGKEGVTEQALNQSLRRRLAIARLPPDQHEQSAPDRRDDRAVYRHACVAHPLQEPDHGSQGAALADVPTCVRTGFRDEITPRLRAVDGAALRQSAA